MKNLFISLIFLVAFFHSTAAYSDSPILSNTNPNWTGSTTSATNFMHGYQFLTNEQLTVTALGFANLPFIPQTANRTVGLWTSTGTLLASTTVINGVDPQINGYRYHTLSSPITLAAGQSYVLAAFHNQLIPVASTNPLFTGTYYPQAFSIHGITFQMGRFLSSPSFVFPTNTSTFGIYLAPSALVTPEPSTYLLLGSMLLGIACLCTYKRKYSKA